MTNRKKLYALPSKVILTDGETVVLDTISVTEQTEVKAKLCQAIEKALCFFYQNDPDSFRSFADEVNKDTENT